MAERRDPRVTDLRRFRRERERARRAAAKRPSEPLLGGRPRAGLILILILAVLAALWIAPNLARRGLAPVAGHAQIGGSKGGNP